MIPFVLKPWHLMIFFVAAWMNREQKKTIEYLITENKVLREKLGKKRILLNDDQRRRLAAKGKVLGRKALRELGTIFTPDTILRWHRELISKKWDYSNRKKRIGRPWVRQVIVDLTVRFAKENESWGYDRIQGALRNLGYRISDTTVANILKRHGIEPAPDRKRHTTWSTFLKAHWEVLGAADFTTIEVWTRGGLVTYYILVVMQLSRRRRHGWPAAIHATVWDGASAVPERVSGNGTCEAIHIRVEIAGVTPNPNAQWVQQVARNLTDYEDGFLRDIRYLLLDRDKNFNTLRGVLESTDTEDVKLPIQSPNLNAYIERFMLSLKSECLERMVFFEERSLRNALTEYVAHYHGERNHQGLGNEIIEPGAEVGHVDGEVQCRNRLGGILRYYYREAA